MTTKLDSDTWYTATCDITFRGYQASGVPADQVVVSLRPRGADPSSTPIATLSFHDHISSDEKTLNELDLRRVTSWNKISIFLGPTKDASTKLNMLANIDMQWRASSDPGDPWMELGRNAVTSGWGLQVSTGPANGTWNVDTNNAGADTVWKRRLWILCKTGSRRYFYSVTPKRLDATASNNTFTLPMPNVPANQTIEYIVGGDGLLAKHDTIAHGSTSGAVALLSGDIDGDNTVTVFDYGVLSDSFDKTSSDTDWNTPISSGCTPRQADLDEDDAVTVFDYGILSDTFDQGGYADGWLP